MQKGQCFFLHNFKHNSNFKLQSLISLLIHQESLSHTLCKTILEILYKILEINLITQIKTLRIEFIRIHPITQSQSTQSPSNPIFTGKMVVVIEMIDTLTMLQNHKINITNSSSPFKVIIRRPNILILIPTPLNQSSTQLDISALYYKYLLVVTHPITSLPCLEIYHLLFLFGLVLFALFILIVVHPLFLLFFAVCSVCYCILGLVFQTSQLIIGDIVKLNSAPVFAPGLFVLG